MIHHMRFRLVALLAVVGLVLSACASAADTTAPSSSAAPSSTAAPTTASSETVPQSTEGTTTPSTPAEDAPEGRPEPDPNRPLAPDFALTLGDGGAYQLSAETRPVYLVFWAEW